MAASGAADDLPEPTSRHALGARWLEAGRGAPLLLLHGIPDTAEAWAPLIARLAPRRRCLAPDLPGFGPDTPAPPPVTLAGLAGALDRLTAALALDEAVRDGPIDVVGHDVGGLYALAWAAERPGRVGRLALLNTGCFADRRWHWGARILRTPGLGALAVRLPSRRGVARELARASNGGLSAAAIAGTAERFGPAARREARRLYRAQRPDTLAAWERRLPEVARRRRLVVLWGEADPYLPPAMADRFGAALVVRFPTLGHWPHREAPETVAAALLRAFDGSGP